MTLNWGHKLTIFISAFAGMIILLVYKSTQTNFDLVTKEYYKDELKYQEVIDGTKRANSLASKASVVKSGETIDIQLPDEMKGQVITGSAWFYCAADAKKDIKIPLAVNAAGKQQISSGLLLPGSYTVKLNWTAAEQQYYSETSLDIQ
ncbi:FixH family protein [Pseudoflavitalea rhizosphaerae]|uniref:FixH family protein n=1 Tax=Pseudoflavitalea rhizosphaerae TaxID=1884793 RepID=UPI000F8F151A|nr:FixH family protein [Pseudoflavitalea rhizosphaerae]